MAVCGRCYLCNRKFECVARRSCDSCAEGDEEKPVPLGSDGSKVCRACIDLMDDSAAGEAVASILRFCHEEKDRK